MKRHHNQGNSYKRKNLIGSVLTISEVQPIIIKVESITKYSRHGAGEVAANHLMIPTERERQPDEDRHWGLILRAEGIQ